MEKEPVPIFEIGETVVATGSYGYTLTEGKQYTVVDYQPAVQVENFTWPIYVTVIGDFGKPVTGHDYRFRSMKDSDV